MRISGHDDNIFTNADNTTTLKTLFTALTTSQPFPTLFNNPNLNIDKQQLILNPRDNLLNPPLLFLKLPHFSFKLDKFLDIIIMDEIDSEHLSGERGYGEMFGLVLSTDLFDHFVHSLAFVEGVQRGWGEGQRGLLDSEGVPIKPSEERMFFELFDPLSAAKSLLRVDGQKLLNQIFRLGSEVFSELRPLDLEPIRLLVCDNIMEDFLDSPSEVKRVTTDDEFIDDAAQGEVVPHLGQSSGHCFGEDDLGGNVIRGPNYPVLQSGRTRV